MWSSFPAEAFYAFYAFYAWWFHFPQSGALAEGTSRPVSREALTADSGPWHAFLLLPCIHACFFSPVVLYHALVKLACSSLFCMICTSLACCSHGHGHGHGPGIFILATHPEGTWTTSPMPTSLQWACFWKRAILHSQSPIFGNFFAVVVTKQRRSSWRLILTCRGRMVTVTWSWSHGHGHTVTVT